MTYYIFKRVIRPNFCLSLSFFLPLNLEKCWISCSCCRSYENMEKWKILIGSNHKREHTNQKDKEGKSQCGVVDCPSHVVWGKTLGSRCSPNLRSKPQDWIWTTTQHLSYPTLQELSLPNRKDIKRQKKHLPVNATNFSQAHLTLKYSSLRKNFNSSLFSL